MRILAIVAPYFGDPPQIHLNARQDIVWITTDRIVDFLLERGHQVVYCNLAGEQFPQTVYASGLPLQTKDTLKRWDFDVVWHCIKDPTPAEHLPRVEELRGMIDGSPPVLNDVNTLQHWTKPYYYRLLKEKGIPVPQIVSNEDYVAPQVGQTPQFIRIPDRNNDRSDGQTITVRFIDNRIAGQRAFFRVPYASGKVMSGTLYKFPPHEFVAKTGAATERTPFTMPLQFAFKLGALLNYHDVGIAHIEGFVNEQGTVVAIFDVNPFPCSDGKTFDPMSRLIAERIEHVYDV